MKLTDNDIIKRIQADDARVWTYIEDEFYGMIEAIVVSNSGSKNEATDLWQEVMVAVFINVKKVAFELTCKFKTYLYSIAYKQWMSVLRSKKKPNAIPELQEIPDYAESIEDIKLKIEKEVRIRKLGIAMPQLNSNCQEIIKLSMKKISQKDIAEKLNFKSVGVLKVTKSRCLKQLKSLIS